MSSVPSTAPPNAPPAAHAPVPVPPRSSRSGWLIGLVTLAAVAGGVWYWQSQHAAGAQKIVPVRTATVRTAAVARSIRLTGTTAAENFYSINAPSMRGSRGGGNRTSVTGSQSAGSTVASISGTTTSTSSASSTGGTSGGNLSSALRAATSRGGSSAARPNSSGTASPSGSSSTSTSSDGGLGSTASALPGSSGGPPSAGSTGGGGGDFQLVLQQVAKAGAHVRKGTVVAEFDRQFMVNRLDDYRASTHQAEASFRKVMANLEVTVKSHEQDVAAAKAAVDKAKLDLQTVPVRSPIDAERLKLALDEAEARYKQLRSEEPLVDQSQKSQVRIDELDLKQSQLELKRAEANADRLALKAGMDGIVVMQTTFRGAEFGQFQSGDVIGPGVLFMTIVDPRSMVVNASVNQVDAERMRIGAKAKIRFDAYPDLELPAHVYSIGAITRSGGFRANFVRDIPVRLKLDQLDARVIPDLSVSADVVLETAPAGPAVVRAAVMDDPGTGQPYVYVKHDDIWERRRVQVGVMSFVDASVRSGLQPGEIVALETPPADAVQQKDPASS